MPRLLLLAVFSWCYLQTGNFHTGGAEALILTRLDVPLFVDPRSAKIALRCEYDLEGADLYSVKWYRNDFEFFRYMPGTNPPGQSFDLPEVRVDIERCNAKQVTLLGQAEGVDLAGTYACEVSTERPKFLTKYKMSNMSVAVVPKQDPALEGVRASYQVGELMVAECTSAPSYPPANLTFVLNGREVPRTLTRDLTPEVKLPVDGGGHNVQLSTTRLGLKLLLDRTHFPGGSFTLICQSILPGISAARARKTEVTSTLAANNERLAQEPPIRSSASRTQRSSLYFLTTLSLLVFYAVLTIVKKLSYRSRC